MQQTPLNPKKKQSIMAISRPCRSNFNGHPTLLLNYKKSNGSINSYKEPQLECLSDCFAILCGYLTYY